MHHNLTNNMRHCGGGLLFFLSSKKVHKVKNLFRGITHPEVIGVREAQTELSTFVKGMIDVVITFLIYKPLSPILKGYRR